MTQEDERLLARPRARDNAARRELHDATKADVRQKMGVLAVDRAAAECAAAAKPAGRGKDAMTVTGLEVTVDATATGVRRFAVTPMGTWLDATTPQRIRLLPGASGFYVTYARNFTVTAAGMFNYDLSVPNFSGFGTPVLTVR